VANDALTIAESLCKQYEGLYLRPYLCPAGIPTIGYGTTRYENGVKVMLSDPAITAERARGLLQNELAGVVYPAVLALCPNIISWGPKATAAIVDFTYNLGTGRLRASTLRKKIQTDDRAGAKTELVKWVNGGGRVLPGLVKRRMSECALIG
jgi:lysozyme